MQLPARSTLAGGLTGLATWLLTLALAHFGIIVPPQVIGGLVTLATTIAVHVTPDTLKDQANALDVDVKDLAAWIPTVQSGPGDYPDSNK